MLLLLCVGRCLDGLLRRHLGDGKSGPSMGRWHALRGSAGSCLPMSKVWGGSAVAELRMIGRTSGDAALDCSRACPCGRWRGVRVGLADASLSPTGGREVMATPGCSARWLLRSKRIKKRNQGMILVCLFVCLNQERDKIRSQKQAHLGVRQLYVVCVWKKD